MATEYHIFPAVGIARVGNRRSAAAQDYFLGPESPGHRPAQPGGYKVNGEIKRQGARFRIYEFAPEAASGRMVPVREITHAEAEITWEVTLANAKALGPIFPFESDAEGRPVLRNADIEDPTERERQLPLSARGILSAAGGGPVSLDASFMDSTGNDPNRRVHLGDLLTDQAGRLVILGGYGRSFSPDGAPLNDTFNNDGWCDDTADGVIRARVRLRATNEEFVTAGLARVIVGPPDYAPEIDNVISLYDVVADASGLPDPEIVSFSRHIYPILKRVAELRWVNARATAGHGPGTMGDFLDRELLARLRDPDVAAGSEAREAREGVLSRLRRPAGFPSGGGAETMPRLQPELDPRRELTLTPRQFRLMARWAAGDFDPDTAIDLDAPPPPFEAIADVRAQIEALDRAPLDACVGGSFFPGIEAPQIMRDPRIYTRPLRVRDDLPAGALTQGMALPWQTDFLACADDWWPAQRPNRILRRNPQTGALQPVPWAPATQDFASFVTDWSRMGFVVRSGSVFLEDERDEEMAPPPVDPLIAFAEAAWDERDQV